MQSRAAWNNETPPLRDQRGFALVLVGENVCRTTAVSTAKKCFRYAFFKREKRKALDMFFSLKPRHFWVLNKS